MRRRLRLSSPTQRRVFHRSRRRDVRLQAPPRECRAAARGAAQLCGTSVVVSEASTESESALIERLNGVGMDVERMRLLTAASDSLRASCFALGIEIDTEPVSVSGRRELRRWMREQAISRTTHRHGRVAP